MDDWCIWKYDETYMNINAKCRIFGMQSSAVSNSPLIKWNKNLQAQYLYFLSQWLLYLIYYIQRFWCIGRIDIQLNWFVFESNHWPVSRRTSRKIFNLPFSAVSFADLAFCYFLVLQFIVYLLKLKMTWF